MGMSLETPKTGRGPNESTGAYGGKPDAVAGGKANAVAVPSQVSKLQSVLGNLPFASKPATTKQAQRALNTFHGP